MVAGQDADVPGGDVGPETEEGGGARRAVDHDTRLVDPGGFASEVGGPALAGLGGVATAEVAFEHGRDPR